MSIGKLVTRKPVTLGPGDSIAKAAQLMERENIGTVVVTELGKPTGIVTDRDLALATCARAVSPYVPVVTIMTQPVVAIREDEGIWDATCQMKKHSVRRLPIVDQTGMLVGVLSADDLIPLLSQELKNLAERVPAEI